MRIKYFAAGLALLTIAFAPLPSSAQYYGAGYGSGYGYGGGWKATLIRSLAPTLINRGINYLMNRSHQSYQPERNYQQQSAGFADSGSRPSSPLHSQRRTTVSHSVPHSTSHYVSGSPASSHSTHMEVPPPPKMFVPPPPPGVPTGAVLGLYPSDMNKTAEAADDSTNSPMPKPAPKSAPSGKAKAQR